MCEWVDVCPGTWESIENAPCKVALNFMPKVNSTLNQVWWDMQKILEADELFIKTIVAQ